MGLTAGIVGFGLRGTEHAVALAEAEGVSLGGIVDLTEKARERAQIRFSVPAYGELEELLDTGRPEIVILATPADVRGEVTERIAAAGSVRAILIEKPLALRMAEAERMVEVCDREGVLLTVGHQLRFVPHFVALKRLIDSGRLGGVEFIRGLCFGHLLDQGPHLVDAFRWLSGDRRVQWAMSQRGDSATPGAAPVTGDGLTGPVPAWTTHHLALEGGLRCTAEAGPLHQRSERFGQGTEAIDDYLDMRITVVGSGGIAQSVTGGDCRVLSAGPPDWEVIPGGIEGYRSGTRLFHEAIRDSLVRGVPHPADAHEALDSLEGLLACVQSTEKGDAAVLPLERSGASGVQPSARRIAAPEVSVILPLPDHRGYAPRAVSSWTEGQQFDRRRFEVIVASDGTEPELEDEIRSLLGPGDRLIRGDGAHEIELYDQAARVARGKVLLLTEPHCIAEPRFIDELLAHLARTGEVGACGRSVGISPVPLARMEEALFDEGFRAWSRPGNWCKVILRAFAIDRRTYLEVGGFDTDYGRFAEFALAATLHARGKRLGYASGATVEHAYTTRFADLEPPVEDFLRGELEYRLDHPAEYCDRYFGVPGEWAERRLLSKDGARAASALAFRSLFQPAAWRDGSVRSLIGSIRRLTPAALMGPRPALAWASASYSLARLRCRLWRLSEGRLRRAYRDAWDRLSRRSRLRHLAERPAERPNSSAASPFALAELADDRLFGFHGAESVNGTRFRWSRSVAFADVPVEPGAYRVEVDTGGLRDPREIGLQVFFNGRRIPRSRLDLDPRRIAFAVEPEQFTSDGEQRLGFVSVSFQPSRVADSADARELGLPVSSIDFRLGPAAEG